MHIPDYKLLAKQPIYDAENNCVAYELLFRNPMNLSVADVGGEIATSQVLVNYCASVSDQVGKVQGLVFINVYSDFVLNNTSLPVPPENVILELSGTLEVTDELVAQMENWRKNGFRFAIDSYDFSEAHQRLLPLASYVKVDVLAHSANTLREELAKKESNGTIWVAERIEGEYVLDACKTMGFDWFQGYFLAKPAEVVGNSIRPGTAVTVQIIKELDQPGISMDDITRLVAQDPKLTVQMLKIINSSLFSLPRPVEDLKAALVFLGIDMLRQWAMILAFLSNGSVHLEACRLVLLRAKTLQNFVEKSSNNNANEAMAFLVGLVSGVNILLNVTPELFLEQVPLADGIRTAVLDFEGEVGEALKQVKELEYTITQKRHELSNYGETLLEMREDATVWVNEVMTVLKS